MPGYFGKFAVGKLGSSVVTVNWGGIPEDPDPVPFTAVIFRCKTHVWLEKGPGPRYVPLAFDGSDEK
ncbi:hypothetical protein SISNIDRAFT_210518 [Sistotremastrum niveocremeum HHB9708]|uniref:Uncharacterized protein n=1 Tax=Sistotremastrum niveocremeum HHB9708 TaxID=1314777 RepID=A0A164R125_9AGAM|nr:hypothetical protein SISNIDRAFT_210518 [Sistotremastrum niveocremeum HHB9708]